MAVPSQAALRWASLSALVTAGMWALAACSVFSTGATGHTGAADSARGPVAFVAAPSGAPANVLAVAPSGGRPLAVTRGAPPVTEAAWTADGTRVVFARRSAHATAGGGEAGHIDVFVLRRGGTPRPIRRCSLECDPHSFAWSPDGRRIAFVTDIRSRFTGTAGEITVMNADGSGFRAVCTETACGQGLDDPRWSPDGSRLLFSNMGVIGFPSAGILPSRVWVARPDGTGAHPLTQPHCRPGHAPLLGCAYDSAAAWSPDGRWIAFSRLDQQAGPGGKQPQTLIELMRPDGSGLHPVAACSGIRCNQVMPPVWSPDGSRIAYAPTAERGSRIAFVSLGGARSAIRACAGHRCVAPYGLVWAPDGGALGLLGGARAQTAYVIDATGSGMHAVGRAVQCCLAWLPAGAGG